MKFGSNLARNQVPEWASHYINYKALKKLIKAAAEDVKRGGVPDTAKFFFDLDRNLEDVDSFYNKKLGDATRRIKLLQDQYGRALETPNELDVEEAEELMGSLLDLREGLRKLQWYGEVNRRGFVKITKKLDKKVPEHNQRRYIETKVDLKPFGQNANLMATVKLLNDWLFVLGKVEPQGENVSRIFASPLPRVSSKNNLNLPQAVLDALDRSLRSDDGPGLVKILQKTTGEQEDSNGTLYNRLILSFLQKAISSRARSCVAELLNHADSLEDAEDVNKRNCLHRFIISLSRTHRDRRRPSSEELIETREFFIKPAASPLPYTPARWTQEAVLGFDRDKGDESVAFFTDILDLLPMKLRPALVAKDIIGRLPLHYAALYGFVELCKIIIAHMHTWDQFEDTDGIDAPFWEDNEGFAPVHLSVVGGYSSTTKTLLEYEGQKGIEDRRITIRKNMTKAGQILALATKNNCPSIVQLLVDAGIDLNSQDGQGETALHVAARFGHSDCATVLLKGSAGETAKTEIPEDTFGWTPLHVASVEGQLAVVKLLIQAGADLSRKDSSGWIAKEHAALRGHIVLARYLVACEPVQPTAAPSLSKVASASEPKTTVNGYSNGTDSATSFKTFGHRYLTTESMILVSLGSMDMRKSILPVELDQVPLAHAHSTQLDTALSIVVSALNATGEPYIVDLPVQENISTEPIVFHAIDASKVKILFDIVPTYAGSKDKIVGRGVALLSSIKPSIGWKRITLQGDVRVPIVGAHDLEVIGTVNFNFLVVTPFQHPNMSITENHTYWRSMTSTMVIGHRGLGQNRVDKNSLQLGENTIQSFIAAANLGASYVEFGMNRVPAAAQHNSNQIDVQLTKDLVPVIYHDFLVSETGIDAPVHTLTLEQFLHVNDRRTPRSSRAPSPARVINPSVNGTNTYRPEKQRSMSVGTSQSLDADEQMSERMKHTRDFKVKGFKANSRGNFIQAPFTTLEEMFKTLPESIGFNIEMKYPMLYESEEQEMDTYAVELNSFVDTVLTTVYDLGKKRNLIFSSFNPDICLLLSYKQPSVPVLFLTDAGVSLVGDIRASSLQEAIRFASRWGLLGIVSSAEPFVLSPRLVRVVKESGLVCVSYGKENNIPDKVKLQVQEGIDAVIVDSVLAIRKGLTDSESALPQAEIPENIASKLSSPPFNLRVD